MEKLGANQFERLLLGSTQWIDVRAPIEFSAGAVPGAINLPLLNNEERHQIGITYKQQGREAAVKLGHELVSGEVKEKRLRAWLGASQDVGTVIYCFRGGLRSQITQSWLREAGVDRPIITGGYKALRRFLREVLERRIPELEVVSGPTGSGKTPFLHASGRPFLDLEGLAAHRGSAFGAMERAQPSQADFENALALAILRLPKGQKVLIENESRLIGHCYIPESLFQKMKVSPKIRFERPLEERVENIFKDYILDSRLGRSGDVSRFDDFKKSVTAISRKLGGQRAQEILGDIAQSQRDFETGAGLGSNRVWIRKLLEWYYDPFYRKSSSPACIDHKLD